MFKILITANMEKHSKINSRYNYLFVINANPIIKNIQIKKINNESVVYNKSLNNIYVVVTDPANIKNLNLVFIQGLKLEQIINLKITLKGTINPISTILSYKFYLLSFSFNS